MVTERKPVKDRVRVRGPQKEGSTPLGHYKDGTKLPPPPGFKGITNPVDPETGKVATPAQIRRRLRRNPNNVEDQKALFRAHGIKPIEQWDIDELCEGRPKNGDGKFEGRGLDSTWMGPILEAEIKRRIPDVSFKSLTGLVPLAIKTLKHLMTNDEVDDNGKWVVPAAVKRGAAEYVLDQVIGRALLRIDTNQGSKVQRMLASALVLTDEDDTPAHPVIDGQFHEDDADDDSDLRGGDDDD